MKLLTSCCSSLFSVSQKGVSRYHPMNHCLGSPSLLCLAFFLYFSPSLLHSPHSSVGLPPPPSFSVSLPSRRVSSEIAFKLALQFARVTALPSNFSFCVLSRRQYPHPHAGACSPLVWSLASQAPLNGAKCRPCRPCATQEAVRGEGEGGGVRERRKREWKDISASR